MIKWWINSDNVIQVIGLKDARTEAFINGATITGQLYDDAATPATVGSEISLTYVWDTPEPHPLPTCPKL